MLENNGDHSLTLEVNAVLKKKMVEMFEQAV
jgi:hypothetical protein